MTDSAPPPLPRELERRIATVEQSVADDPGLTSGDWLALGLTTIAIPAILIWLGWSG